MNDDLFAQAIQEYWNVFKNQQQIGLIEKNKWFKYLKENGNEVKSLSFRAQKTLRITNDFLGIILSICPNIETLKLERSTFLKGSSLKYLSELTTLKSLTLVGINSLENEGLAQLSGLNNLEFLEVLDCWSLKSEGLKGIAGLSKLQSLNLRGCNGLHNSSFVYLAQLTNLQTLDLSFCDKIWGIWGSETKQLIRLTNLKNLNLTGSNVSDIDLQHVAKIASLQSLNLWGEDFFSDEGLPVLAC